MTRAAILFCLLVAFCSLPGCSKPRIELVIASEPNVNPDVTGRPSPLIVKMFELRRDLAFNQADFQTLFFKPMQALNADLVATDELTLVPGEARRIKYKPNPETRFVGIVAGFRNMDRANWRIIKPVDPEEPNFVALDFNDVAILVIPADQARKWKPETAVKNYEQQITPVAKGAQPSAPGSAPQGAPAAGQAGQPVPSKGATFTIPPATDTPAMSGPSVTPPAVSAPTASPPALPTPGTPPPAPSAPPVQQPLPAMRTM